MVWIVVLFAGVVGFVVLTRRVDTRKLAEDAIALEALWRVDVSLIRAVIRAESHDNPFAMGGIGEVGLMQVTQGALSDYNFAHGTDYTLVNLFLNPLLQVRVGAWYLEERYQIHNSVVKALTAYNQGDSRIFDGSYSVAYAEKVLTIRKEYYT